MSKLEKKQGQKTNSPKGKFFDALEPLKNTVEENKKIKVVNKLLEILEKPETKMPSGKNANTEKFILGLSISFCLFKDNKKTLLEKGGPLLKYTLEHAKKVPNTKEQAHLVTAKFKELITRIKK